MADEGITQPDAPVRGLVIGCLAVAGGLVGAGLLLLGLLWFGAQSLFDSTPEPEIVASSSLEGLREQNVLTPFTARYVAVVTASESRLGGMLNAQKTLILPGTVRYELDLSELGQDDLAWDEDGEVLTLTIPDVRIAGPEVDLADMREFREGKALLAVTKAEDRLDLANRDAAVADILKQAQADTPVKLAREAARKAVATNFELPLRAAGLEATVKVEFAHEKGSADPRDLDRSRRPEDVLKDQKAGEGP